MRKLFLLLLGCSICWETLLAQVIVGDNKNMLFNSVNTFIPVMGNAPVDNTRTIDISEGSLFFQNEWAKSKIFTEDLHIYQDISTKINLMNNKIHYLDSLGRELIVSVPVRQITFVQKNTGKEIQFINGNILPVKREGLYLLLFNDSLSLVKGFKKDLQQHTSYGSATEYAIKTDESYYLYARGKEFEIRKNSDFIEALPSKKNELEQFIKGLNKKTTREGQFVLLAEYCNSLLNKGAAG